MPEARCPRCRHPKTNEGCWCPVCHSALMQMKDKHGQPLPPDTRGRPAPVDAVMAGRLRYVEGDAVKMVARVTCLPCDPHGGWQEGSNSFDDIVAALEACGGEA